MDNRFAQAGVADFVATITESPEPATLARVALGAVALVRRRR